MEFRNQQTYCNGAYTGVKRLLLDMHGDATEGSNAYQLAIWKLRRDGLQLGQRFQSLAAVPARSEQRPALCESRYQVYIFERGSREGVKLCAPRQTQIVLPAVRTTHFAGSGTST